MSQISFTFSVEKQIVWKLFSFVCFCFFLFLWCLFLLISFALFVLSAICWLFLRSDPRSFLVNLWKVPDVLNRVTLWSCITNLCDTCLSLRSGCCLVAVNLICGVFSLLANHLIALLWQKGATHWEILCIILVFSFFSGSLSLFLCCVLSESAPLIYILAHSVCRPCLTH